MLMLLVLLRWTLSLGGAQIVVERFLNLTLTLPCFKSWLFLLYLLLLLFRCSCPTTRRRRAAGGVGGRIEEVGACRSWEVTLVGDFGGDQQAGARVKPAFN